MRSYPGCWNKTLAQLGFRRKRRKNKRQNELYRRRSLFEALEQRQMLSSDPLLDYETAETIVVSSEPQYAFATASAPEFHLIQPEIPAEELAGLPPEEIENIEPYFAIQTVATETGPKAILSLNSSYLDRPPTTLQKLRLKLRQDGRVLEAYDILIDLAEQEFRDQFLSDRVDKLAPQVADLDRPAEARWQRERQQFKDAEQLKRFVGPLTLEDSERLQSLELKLAHQAAPQTDVLLSVAKRQATQRDLIADNLDREHLYGQFSKNFQQLEQARENATTDADRAAVATQEQSLRNAALLLGKGLAQDAQSKDINVASAARQLRGKLVEISDPMEILFAGLNVDREVERKINNSGDERALSFVESGNYQFSDHLEIDLGRHQAMIQVTRHNQLRVAPLISVSGTPTVEDGSINETSPTTNGGTATSMHVVGTASAARESLVRFNLGQVVDFNNPTTISAADLQLSEIGTGIGNANVYVWNGLFDTPTGGTNDWDETNLTWNHVSGTLGLSGKLSEFTQLSNWSAGTTTSVDVTTQLRRAALFGDADGDGEFDAAGGDIEAFHLAVTNWDAYAAEFGPRASTAADLLARTDGGLGDGTIDTNDISDFFRRHGVSQGDFNLDGTVQDNEDATINGLDWSVWQANYGLTNAKFTQGDGNFDGVVDDLDYDIWLARKGEDNLTAEEPELVFWVRPENATTDIEFATHEHATLNGPTLSVTEQPDLALNKFSVSGNNLVVDYAVLGETFSNVKVQIYKAGSPDTLLHETAVQSGALGSHQVLIATSVLSSIVAGDSVYAKVVGTPTAGTQANTANDQLDFEFSTAATQTVNSLDDVGMDQLLRDKYTLRELFEANESLGWYDTINFDATMFTSGEQTISLGDVDEDGDIDYLGVSTGTTIVGPGSHLLTIDARHGNRHFYVNSGSTLALEGLHLTGGQAPVGHGGSISSFGDLTLDSVEVTDNHAVTSLAGAISSQSPAHLTIINSTFANNTANKGGALAISSSATNGLIIDRSSLIDNKALGSSNAVGGAIYFFGSSTQAKITSSTFSGNHSDKWAGAIQINGTTNNLTIVNSTITENESVSSVGGIRNTSSGTVTLHNSIVAGNTGSWQYTVDIQGNVGGTVSDPSSYNLVGVWESNQGINNGVNNNQMGTAATPLDPMLREIDTYGANAPTLVPLSASPVSGMGSFTLADAHGVGLSQTGINHTVISTNIGAAVGYSGTITVTTPVDEFDSNLETGEISLREALELARQSEGTDLIKFSPADFSTNQTITLSYHDRTSGTLLYVDSDVTIVGPGPDLLTIDAGLTPPGMSAAAFRVHGPGTLDVEISGIKVTGADASLAAIYNHENLTLVNSEISGNDVRGIFNYYGTLNVQSSVISDNNSNSGFPATQWMGGAILNFAGNVTIEQSSITQNTASRGGAIANLGVGNGVQYGDVTIRDSIISQNTSTSSGGGIYNLGGNVTLEQSTISNNSAIDGGGISHQLGYYQYSVYSNPNQQASDPVLTISNSTISGNNASNDGGGIHTGRVNRSTISYSAIYGGLHQAKTQISNSTISGNIADGSGGGLFSDAGEVSITNATIASNQSDDGGGIRANNVSKNLYIPPAYGYGWMNVTYSGSLESHNTIIAKNTTANSTADDVRGEVNFEGVSSHNLIGSGGSGGLQDNDANNNLVLIASETPGLSPLGEHGGPTQTHALLVGSPALDAGDQTQLTGFLADQRGAEFDRVVDSQIDIGAYEANSNTADIIFVVDISGSTNEERDWLTTNGITTDLESALASRHVYAPRFGLLGYSDKPAGTPYHEKALIVGDSYMGSAEQFEAATTTPFENQGGKEDGYEAIDFLLSDPDYGLRAKVPVNIILLTDADRTSQNILTNFPGNDYDYIRDKLLNHNATLNVIVDHVFDGTFSPGIDLDENLVIGVTNGLENQKRFILQSDDPALFEIVVDNPTCSPGSSFSDCFFEGQTPVPDNEPAPNTYSDYMTLAWETGGATWDINALADDPNSTEDDARRAAFKAALVEIKAQEIASPGMLIENEDFVVDYRQEVTLAANTQALSFQFEGLTFDQSDPDAINDAFEVALVDAQGRSVVDTIGPDRNSFFNITEDNGGSQIVVSGSGVDYDAVTGKVTVDVTHLPEGGQYTLISRLVNSDGLPTNSDTTTEVNVIPGITQLTTAPVTAPQALSLPAFRNPNRVIDVSRLSNISAQVEIDYTGTSYNEETGILTVSANFTNTSQYPVRGPIILGFQNLTRAVTALRDVDGIAPNGMAYYDVTDLVIDPSDPTADFEPGTTGSHSLDIKFYNPRPMSMVSTDWRFDYQPVVMGLINEDPFFETSPRTKITQGAVYEYDADADDPDDDVDDLTFTKMSGPSGLSIDSNSGKVTWDTSVGPIPIGFHGVQLRVDDPYGGSALQTYSIEVTAGQPNVAPLFTSDHVVNAYVGEEWIYDATAYDEDGDNLTFSATNITWPSGVTSESISVTDAEADAQNNLPERGELRWTPSGEMINQIVTITESVNDGNNLPVQRTFDVYVHPKRKNSAPSFTTSPKRKHYVPDFIADVIGNVSPNEAIHLELAPGEILGQTVSIDVPILQSIDSADIIFAYDNSGSTFGLFPWMQNIVTEIDVELAAKGIVNRRYGLIVQDTATAVVPVAFGNDYWGTAAEFQNAIPPQEGGEDMYVPIDYVLNLDNEYYSANDKPDVGTTFIIVSDTGRSEFKNTSITRSSLVDPPNPAIGLSDGSVVHAFVPTMYVADDGSGNIDDLVPVPQRGTWELSTENPGDYAYDRYKATSGSDPVAIAMFEHLDLIAFQNKDESTASTTFRFPKALDQYTNTDPDTGIFYVLDYQDADHFDYEGLFFDDIDNDNDKEWFTESGTFDGTNSNGLYWTTSGGRTLISPPSDDAYVLEYNIDNLPTQYPDDSDQVLPLGIGVLNEAALEHFVLNFLVSGEGGEYDSWEYNFGHSGHLPGVANGFEPVLGIDTSTGSAYLTEQSATDGVVRIDNFYDISGSIPLPRGIYSTVDVYEDYILLADDTGGSVWNFLNIITAPDELAAAFADAHVNSVLKRLGGISLSATGSGDLIADFDTTPQLPTTDDGNGNDTLNFPVTFTGDGNAHVFNLNFDQDGQQIGQIPVAINASYLYLPVAEDPDGDTLTYTALAYPSWVEGITPDPVTGLLRIEGVPDAAGDYQFHLRVEDPWGNFDEQEFTLHVETTSQGNSLPLLDPINITAEVGRDFAHIANADDPDGETPRYYLVDGTNAVPTGMSIDTHTGKITWTPTVTDYQAVHDTGGDNDGQFNLKIRAYDASGYTEESLTITLTDPERFTNQRPRFTSIPITSAVVGDRYQYDVDAVDDDGDDVTFELRSAPEGMVIDSETGEIAWRPSQSQQGVHHVLVRAQDDWGGSRLHSFRVRATAPNEPPTIVSNAPDGVEGTTWNYQIEADDPNGDDLLYFLDNASVNRGMSISSSGLITWQGTHPAMVAGIYAVQILVDDGRGGRDSDTFDLTIHPAGHILGPRITAPPVLSATVGDSYTYSFQVTGAAPNEVQLNQAAMDLGMSITHVSGIDFDLVWTNPTPVGKYPVVITATNNNGTDGVQFDLPVREPIEAPEFTKLPSGVAYMDVEWSFTVEAVDPDGGNVTVELISGPELMTSTDLGGGKLQLTWTPSENELLGERSALIHLRATDDDPDQSTVDVNVWLPILENAPPRITSIPRRTTQVSQAYQYDFENNDSTVEIDDPNSGDSHTYQMRITPRNSGQDVIANAIDQGTGTVTWTPDTPGIYDVQIIVTDQDGAAGLQEYVLNVHDSANSGPSIDPTIRSSIPAGREFVYPVIATDIDFDPITKYEIIGNPSTQPTPSGLTIHPTTGIVRWTPTAADINGSNPAHEFTVRVTSGEGARSLTAEHTFSVNVVEQLVNGAPNFESEPRTKMPARQLYVYEPQVSDPDNDPTFLQLTAAPDGMTLDAQAGRLTWIPRIDQVGEHTVRLLALDRYGGVGEQEFTITVTGLNRPPRIDAALPNFGMAGTDYIHTIQASDPDGDDLTYALTDEFGSFPAGLNLTSDIDPLTGEITWTNPSEGSYVIGVTVTDEFGAKTKQGFSVVIANPVTTNEVPTFDWPPPLYAAIGDAYSFDLNVSDPEGTTPQYTLVAKDPSTGQIDPDASDLTIAGGVITWSNGVSGPAKTYDVTVTITDPAANGVTFTNFYTLTTVSATPLAVNVADQQVEVGDLLMYDLGVVDPTSPINLGFEYFQLTTPTGLENQVTIDDHGIITWQTTPDTVEQVYGPFSVTVKDGVGREVTSSDFSIEVLPDTSAPDVVIQVSDLTPDYGEEYLVRVVATDNLGVKSIELKYDPDGMGLVPLVLDDAGVARLTAPSISTPILFQATATDINENVSSPVTTTVFPADPFNGIPPIVQLITPVDSTFIEEPTEVVVTVTDETELASYLLEIAPADPYSPTGLGTFRTLFASEANPTNITAQSIATLNPSALPNGLYALRLTGNDTGGNTVTDQVLIQIDTPTKLGNFALSFTDLTVPVAGIPITVQRTYDTLRADEVGDFGHGWSLDILSGKLDIQMPTGAEDAFWQSQGFQPALTAGGRMTVTLPGGITQSFTAQPVPINDFDSGGRFGSILALADIWGIAFVPDPGQGSRLDFTGGSRYVYPGEYQDLIAPELLSTEEGAFFYTLPAAFDQDTNQFLSPGTGANSGLGLPINPATFGYDYRLTQPDGSRYVFDSSTGALQSFTDALGNTIYFHNDSLSAFGADGTELGGITIERSGGKITSITDPAGQRIEYRYDALDNLISFTDREAVIAGTGSTTQYRYGEDKIDDPTWPVGDPSTPVPDHILTSIINALEVPTLQVGFDGNGRLLTIQDAGENTAGFEYTLDGTSVQLPSGYTVETVADAFTSKTEVVRDARGNVVRSIQHTGTDTYLVSVFDYDDQDNQTAQYQPFPVDEAVGADGPNARYTMQPTAAPISRTQFDKFNRPEVIYDAEGDITTTYKYDGAGRPTHIIDGAGNPTENTYNSKGQLEQTTDAADGVTRFGYDFYGNLQQVRRVDELGAELVQTTLFYTDGQNGAPGRLSESVDPDNNSRYFVYDATGNQTISYQHWTDPNNPANLLTLATATTFDGEGRAKATKQYSIDGHQTLFNGYDFTQTGVTLLSSSQTEYDVLGRVQKTTDRFNNESYTLYDSRGNVVETRTQTEGTNLWIVTRTAYDKNGRAIATTDPMVLSNALAPTEQGFSTGADTLLKPDGVTTLPTADYRATHTLYDQLGRVEETRRLQGLTAQITISEDPVYDGVYTTSFAEGYDDGPSFDRATFANLLSYNRTYFDTVGRVKFTFDTAGLINETEYDDNGRTTASIQYVTGKLDDEDNPTAVIEESPGAGIEKQRTEFDYDAAGRQYLTTQVIDLDGGGFDYRETRIEYDALGRAVKTIFDNGTVTETHYNHLGQREAEIAPYDPANPPADLAAITTTYGYDPVTGRLLTVTLPKVLDADLTSPTSGLMVNPVYTYGYDTYGNQTSITDPKGHVTQFTFDEQGRQTSRTLPETQAETFEYDEFGRQTRHVSFEGVTTDFIYDQFGRLDKKHYFDFIPTFIPGAGDDEGPVRDTNEVVDYIFDALGRTTKVIQDYDGDLLTTADQRVTDNTYDVEGRLDVETTSEGTTPVGTIDYDYDSQGRLTRTATGTDPVNSPRTATEYDYDRLGRLTEVKQTHRNGSSITPELTTYRYDVLGNLDQIDRPGNILTDYGYDELNRLKYEVNFVDVNGNNLFDGNPTDTLLSDFTYTVLDDGKRTQAVEQLYDGTNTYTNTFIWDYDDAGRLISESLTSDDPNLNDYDDTFKYDLVGNRVEYVHDSAVNTNDKTVTYTYDDNDRLITEKRDVDGTANDRFLVYTYDVTQQTGKTVHAGLDATGTAQETTTNTYNLQSRLSQVDIDPDGATGSAAHKITKYEYDDAGFRVLKDVDGTVTRYLADANNHTGYTQVLEETDAAGNLQKSFLLGHDVIAQFDVTNGLVYLIYDGHGSTRQLTNFSGTIVTPMSGPATGITQVFTYNAYGETLGVVESQAITALLYSGEWFEVSIGQQYLRARYYAADNGRFNRLDPYIGDLEDPQSLHKYVYSHNAPSINIDPTGLFSLVENSVSNGIQSKLRGINAANKARTFKKVYNILDRIEGFYDAASEVYDLLDFDINDLTEFASSVSSISALVSKIPSRPKSFSIDLPVGIRNKLRKLGGRVFDLIGRNRAQEAVGEAITSLLIQAIGFEQSPTNWSWSTSKGPDQIARHTTGVWGIFEAKGGTSQLGRGRLAQMRGPWLRKWLRTIIEGNAGQYSDDLRQSFRRKEAMLAAVVRLDLLSRDPSLKITIQKFDPPDGRNMRNWGDA